ncbi:helix-turn-helix domain-containing protein [Planctomicrobium sp. SH661]|uniref:helix-turn-helix domain-containing protein n=1 Tax=Planctomicrobium sp. SH661 TaxID=3448124 RepID=UPI003F5B1484
MKTIMAMVFPVTENAPHELIPGSNRIPETGATGDLSFAQREGTVRLEITVTDAVASKVMSTILNVVRPEPVSDATLDDLLHREVANAGPDACDLYERIVSRIEERLLCQVYAECDGVKTRTADRLGINRNTLHRMLQQHGVKTEE